MNSRILIREMGRKVDEMNGGVLIREMGRNADG